jgi:putative PEP-CTERM system integral membrane protein
MANHSKAVQEALGTLAAYSANVDVYLTSSIYRGESPSRVNLIALSDKSLSYVGGQNAAELIQQFFTLYKGEKYDGLFILTDGSGFKLGEQTISMTAPDMPVWIVHLDGNMPLGYDDATLEIIQASQGGVAQDINEALTRLTFALKSGRSIPSKSTTDWVDGYEWTVASKGQIISTGNAISHGPEDPFAAIAARRLILDAMYRQRGQLTQISTLDQLHAIAVTQNIVTPYSSMIVLINKFQQLTLDQLEEQADRYQREAETVGETSFAAPFQVTGVPEPHEWLLLILTAGMLGWYIFRRNK